LWTTLTTSNREAVEFTVKNYSNGFTVRETHSTTRACPILQKVRRALLLNNQQQKAEKQEVTSDEEYKRQYALPSIIGKGISQCPQSDDRDNKP
jgi:hypothetical protein